MKAIPIRNVMAGLLAAGMLHFCQGCATHMVAKPIFTTSRPIKELETLRLVEARTPPETKPTSILITIPQKKSIISTGGAVMRQGATIKTGSSIVISLPAKVETSTPDSAFKTDGYFHELEHHIERGLLSIGFQVKDRARFEAKLRDQTKSSPKPWLLYDIAELIRAAQDGDIMADYVLQVNEISVTPYAGQPLQLALLPEVRAALAENPGLRVGGDEGKALPASMQQPLWQARFNAKLIETKTGSIEWAGEYTTDSLSVLEKGISIGIGVRRKVTNGQTVENAVYTYNTRMKETYQDAVADKQNLERKCSAAMQSVPYQGTAIDLQRIQNDRLNEVEYAEQAYTRTLTAYQTAVRNEPAEVRAEWTFDYDVDAPMVKPNLTQPQTDHERNIVKEHINVMGYSVVHDLLATIHCK